MKKALEDMHVEIMEGRVDVAEPDVNGKVTTRGGEVLEGVDMILNAAGFVFSGASLADDALNVDVTKRGQFQCRPTLQLKGQDSVFCCGDILDVPKGCFADVKGLMHGQQTGETVAHNVVAKLEEMPLKDFKWSKVPINKPMMTALGPNKGLGHMGKSLLVLLLLSLHSNTHKLFAPGLPNFMQNFIAKKVKSNDYYMSVNGNSMYGKGKTW